MTDLDKHVNQPGRAKLVKQVRAKIYLIASCLTRQLIFQRLVAKLYF